MLFPHLSDAALGEPRARPTEPTGARGGLIANNESGKLGGTYRRVPKSTGLRNKCPASAPAIVIRSAPSAVLRLGRRELLQQPQDELARLAQRGRVDVLGAVAGRVVVGVGHAVHEHGGDARAQEA